MRHVRKLVSIALMLGIAGAILVQGALAGAILPSFADSKHSAPGGQSDWPQYRYDSARTANNALESTINTSNVASLAVGWKVGLPDGDATRSAVVVNGVVYVGSSDTNDLFALNAVSGELVWSAATTAPVSSPPAAANGLIYVGDASGTLNAFEARTGALVWQRSVGSCSPAVVATNLYVGGRRVYALDALTGRILWGQGINGTSCSPAVVGERIYVASSDGRLYALEAATGARVWRSDRLGLSSVPALAQGVLYLNSEGHFEALDARDGSLLWRLRNLDLRGAPAVGGNMAFVTTTQSLIAIDTSTRTISWQVPATLGSDTIEGSPVIANGVVYLAVTVADQEEGALEAFDASNGTLLWTGNPDSGFFFGEPVVADGHVYAPYDFDFVAFGLP